VEHRLVRSPLHLQLLHELVLCKDALLK
jgi:hypothetical protein